MTQRIILKSIGVLLLVLVWGFLSGLPAQSQHSSPNYQLNESFIGNGGLIESDSAGYDGRSAIGGSAVGPSESGNYQVEAGYITPDEARLSFWVNTTLVPFGDFSPISTATGNASFNVLNYTSHGYVVFVAGSPPGNGSHTLTALGTNSASQTGTEQFGINLKANTLPISFGADPVQIPDDSFAFGEAAPNYDSANSYRFVEGEAVARSLVSSGQTNYTISYIINVANSTPGGIYETYQDLICVGTY